MQNPLSNIKNIQCSLLQMQARISNLSKRQLENTEYIEKTFAKSMSVIKTKLNECKQKDKVLNESLLKQNINSSKLNFIKQQRLIHEKQLTKSRQILTNMKFNQSQLVKSLSRQNHNIIQHIHKQDLERKKKRNEIIKQAKEKSKTKIKEFHQIKQQQLRRKKQQQQKQNLIRLYKLQKKKNKLQQQQSKLLERQKSTFEVLKNLRFAVRKMKNMPTKEFETIKDKLELENKQLTEQTIENVINEILQTTL